MNVSVGKTLAIDVASCIKDLGYAPANLDGVFLLEVSASDTLGVLAQDPLENQRHNSLKLVFLMLLGIVTFQSRKFMGVINFNDISVGTKHYTWHFKVYGNDNFQECIKIGEKLSQKFDVSIYVELVSEKIRYEKTYYGTD